RAGVARAPEPGGRGASTPNRARGPGGAARKSSRSAIWESRTRSQSAYPSGSSPGRDRSFPLHAGSKAAGGVVDAAANIAATSSGSSRGRPESGALTLHSERRNADSDHEAALASWPRCRNTRYRSRLVRTAGPGGPSTRYSRPAPPSVSSAARTSTCASAEIRESCAATRNVPPSPSRRMTSQVCIRASTVGGAVTRPRLRKVSHHGGEPPVAVMSLSGLQVLTSRTGSTHRGGAGARRRRRAPAPPVRSVLGAVDDLQLGEPVQAPRAVLDADAAPLEPAEGLVGGE